MKVSTNSDSAFCFFLQPPTYATSCECPKRLMMPWLHTFPCVVVPNENHLVSRAVLNQAIVEWNALFRILSLLRLGTRWSQAFSFGLFVASDGIIRLGRRPFPTCYGVVDLFVCTQGDRASAVVLLDSSSETLLACYRHQLSGCCIYIANACIQFPTISRHRWKWLKVFFFLRLRWGSWHEVFFFPRLPIRTIINPIVKNVTFYFVFFYHWVALITLISLGNYRLRKKMNECSVFHCVLWLHTNNFKGFFCYCNFL